VNGNNPLGIAAGGDGNLWIIDDNGTTPDDTAIVRFNTAGLVQGAPIKPGGRLQQAQITAGPAGQVAFTQPTGNTVPQRMGRIDFSGHIDFTVMPGGTGVDPTGIVFGNDGAYWTATFANDKLGRLTPDGTFTQPISFPPVAGPRYLAKGAGDTLFVSLEQGKKIARVTGVSAPPPPPPPPPPPDTAPTISAVSLSRTTFAIGSLLPKLSRKTPVGTTISFRVDQQSTTTFAFSAKKKGFKVGKRCKARAPKGRRAKRCTRFVRVGGFRVATPAGSHKERFQGRISRRRTLRPGRYRLTLTATDSAGNQSKPRSASFRLLRK
jgi:hypothetical protein